MAEFCEECPMRGSCKGQLDELDVKVVTGSRFGTGAFMATIGAFVDKMGRRSELIDMPSSLSVQGLEAEIADCEYPDYEKRGLFRRKQVPICRAIGEYACKERDLAAIAGQAMSAQSHRSR